MWEFNDAFLYGFAETFDASLGTLPIIELSMFTTHERVFLEWKSTVMFNFSIAYRVFQSTNIAPTDCLYFLNLLYVLLRAKVADRLRR